MARYELSSERVFALKLVLKKDEEGRRERREAAHLDHVRRTYGVEPVKPSNTLFGDKLFAACFTSKEEK